MTTGLLLPIGNMAYGNKNIPTQNKVANEFEAGRDLLLLLWQQQPAVEKGWAPEMTVSARYLCRLNKHGSKWARGWVFSLKM
jgi:hypothetical protein